jgi:hypothetical protein
MIAWKTKLEPDFLLLPCRNFAPISGFLVVACIVTRISIEQHVAKLIWSPFTHLFFLMHWICKSKSNHMLSKFLIMQNSVQAIWQGQNDDKQEETRARFVVVSYMADVNKATVAS